MCDFFLAWHSSGCIIVIVIVIVIVRIKVSVGFHQPFTASHQPNPDAEDH